MNAKLCRFDVGLLVAYVVMAPDEGFENVNKEIDYDTQLDNILLAITHGKRDDGSTAWVIPWLAVPNHEKRTVDTGLITTEAAMLLLAMSPLDSVGQVALRELRSDYSRRLNATIR